MSDDVSGMYSPPQGVNAGWSFGRAWWVTIINRQFAEGTNQATTEEVVSFGQKTWTPESLHITFDATQAIQADWWTATIEIYNMNAPTTENVILYGMQVKLEAGYMDSDQYGTVFEGTIIQPIWEQENGVDWKLTLNCIVGLLESANNFVANSAPAQITQRQLLAQMLQKSRYPLQTNFPSLDDSKKITRPTTYFGQPNDLLQAVADSNKQILWYSDMMANIMKLETADQLPTWRYSAGSGIVGTPEQTEQGVSITVLLDPRLILFGQIQLDMSLIIKRNQYTIGNVPNILSQSGVYFIGGLHHYGDSRGNQWYTDITGVWNYSLQSLFTEFHL